MRARILLSSSAAIMRYGVLCSRPMCAVLLGSAALILISAGSACGPADSSSVRIDAGGDDPDIVPLPDEDGDTIADQHEGRDQNVDTDGDGTADYLDTDSDGDGIPDYREAGDNQSGTPPFDSDGDSVPDFRDTDSDNNGRLDTDDGVQDIDNDGVANFADPDDDGDTLLDTLELGVAPNDPVDTDDDLVFDFQDIDSDGDTILDRHELAADPDLDGRGAYIDLDTDGDCVPDALEAGDADPLTIPIDTDGDLQPDYRDFDSDNDGLKDGLEDVNCDGVQDPGESSTTDADSDDDGVSDMIEVAAGTDPSDDSDNPRANGDFVFIVPYEGATDPQEDDLDFSTELQRVDVYVLMDLSGSMSGELASIRNNMETVLDNLACPPLGSGMPGDCIQDLWSGAGTYTYAGRDPYINRLDVQEDPSMVAASLPANADNGSCPGGCNEPHLLATWATCTGDATSASSCTPGADFTARATCDMSPAGPGGIGYPCFRPNSLPVIMLATDEPPSTQYMCPGFASAASAANDIGAKVIGILGSAASAATTTDLNTLATDTGTVDTSGTPLVFNGSDAAAASAIENAIRTLADSVPLDVSASPSDDPSDAVDAVAAFIDHLETLQLGTPECSDGLADDDSNGDGYDDLYRTVLPGTPVCWKLIPKNNTTVMPTDEPQLFQATIEVFGDSVTLLDTRDVFFLVPPVIPDIPID